MRSCLVNIYKQGPCNQCQTPEHIFLGSNGINKEKREENGRNWKKQEETAETVRNWGGKVQKKYQKVSKMYIDIPRSKKKYQTIPKITKSDQKDPKKKEEEKLTQRTTKKAKFVAKRREK